MTYCVLVKYITPEVNTCLLAREALAYDLRGLQFARQKASGKSRRAMSPCDLAMHLY